MSGSGVNPAFAVSGSLASSGSTDWFGMSDPFNIALSGTWSGTVALEASWDNGTTVVNCLMPDGTPSAFATNGLYAVPNVWEVGLRFRLTFTRVSGTLNWRISQ